MGSSARVPVAGVYCNLQSVNLPHYYVPNNFPHQSVFQPGRVPGLVEVSYRCYVPWQLGRKDVLGAAAAVEPEAAAAEAAVAAAAAAAEGAAAAAAAAAPAEEEAAAEPEA